MIERKFIEDHIKSLEIEEYLAKVLEKADYSHTDIQITPLSTRLVVHVGRPGIAIGRAGKNIEMITSMLSEKFGVKNPQLDIQSIESPDLDATYVAHQISSAIERYVKPNRITSIYLRNIMRAGAYGAEIQISGKISGGRGRTDKKQVGYIKKSGEFAVDNVDHGFSTAKMKPGVLGIKVMIMKALPECMLIEKKIKEYGLAEIKEVADKKAADKKAKEPKADVNADVKETEKDDVVKEVKKDEKKEDKKDKKKAVVKKEKETKTVAVAKSKKEIVRKEEKATFVVPTVKKETTKKEVKKEDVVDKKVAGKVESIKKEDTKIVAKEEKK
ncbi:MAG: 30S ribosomal protein S3 [DPANN group archaeon]|nr:30S ribosomal protein S3 [DPANN group archaeon]